MVEEQRQDKHQKKADALKALAAGQTVGADAPSQSKEPPAEAAETSPDILGEEAKTIGQAEAAFMRQNRVGDPPAEPIDVPVRSRTAAERKARDSDMQRKAKRVYASQFKAIMIPLLIVSGLLLIILATWVYLKMPPSEEQIHASDNLLNKPWMCGVVLAAYPLAVILLLGAALFYRDVRQDKQKNQSE